MTSSTSEKETSPGRILSDVGGGFAIGAVGGSIIHFFKGLRASPNGARFIGGMQALRMNGPRIGGVFAVWSGLIAAFDCAAVYVRQKEDPLNSIFAGAATSGLLSARKGLRYAGLSAVAGGALMAFIEGMRMQVAKAAEARQNQLQVDNSNLAAAAAVANHVHAPQQKQSQDYNRELANNVVNSVRAAHHNLPPVDE